MRVVIAEHPLITHKLTVLRDKRTPPPIFRQLVEELMTLLAYEATREVNFGQAGMMMCRRSVMCCRMHLS